MDEPVFHDKEEAWAYYAEQQKKAWESLSEDELIAQVEKGNYDLFFTLPDVIAAKLPREKAILTLFRKVLRQDTDYLVNYHTLNQLVKLLGEPKGIEDSTFGDLYTRVNRGFWGEEKRLAACRELWQKIVKLYPKLAAEEPDFRVPENFLNHRFEVVYRYGRSNFSFHHPGKPYSVATFEEAIRAKFDTFRSWAYTKEDAQLAFHEDNKSRWAVITGFNFECQVTIRHATKQRRLEQDQSPGPWFLANPIVLVKEGERNYDLESLLADAIRDPLGIGELDYSRFNN